MKQYFTYNQTKICYYIIGTQFSKICLFLHGWGTNSKLWMSSFLKLKDKYTLIFIDFPPFGQSQQLLSPWTIEDYANAVIYLLKLLNVKKINIVAHSFGFRVAIYLSYLNVNICKIVSICGAGIEKKSIQTKLKILKYKFIKFMVKLKFLNNSKLTRYGSRDFISLSPTMKKTFINITNTNLYKHLKFVKAKTLLLYSKDDDQIRLKDAFRYKKKIKNSELYIFEDGGHFLFLTKESAIKEAINIFL